MSLPTKVSGLVSPEAPVSVDAASPGSTTRERYAPPCIEDDLPLEVMSLACTGIRPKGATPFPCRTAGSLATNRGLCVERWLGAGTPAGSARSKGWCEAGRVWG